MRLKMLHYNADSLSVLDRLVGGRRQKLQIEAEQLLRMLDVAEFMAAVNSSGFHRLLNTLELRAAAVAAFCRERVAAAHMTQDAAVLGGRIAASRAEIAALRLAPPPACSRAPDLGGPRRRPRPFAWMVPLLPGAA